MEFKKRYILIILIIIILMPALYLGYDYFITDFNNRKNDNNNENDIYLPTLSVETLNPLLSYDKDVYHISKCIYSSLFYVDENLIPKKDLVKDYKLKGDALEIKLRDDVYWHNGDKFTAKDVVFTYNLIRNLGKNSIYNYKTLNIANITKKSKYELIITFRNPDNKMLSQLTFPILNQKETPNSQTLIKNKINYMPIGTGRYTIKNVNSITGIRLEPFKKYYGKVAKNNLVFTILNQAQDGFSMVNGGVLSLLYNDLYNREGYIEKENVKIRNYLSNHQEILGFNLERNLTSKLPIRKAIAYGIKRSNILKNSYYDKGVISDSLYFPNGLNIDSNEDYYNYDEEKVLGELKVANLEDKNRDGVLETQDKEKLELDLIVEKKYVERVVSAKLIKNQLSKFKININIIELDGKEFLERFRGKDFDIVLFGIDFDEGYDLSTIVGAFGQLNYIGYKNEIVETKLKTYKSSLSTKERKKAIIELKELLANDLPYYSLLHTTYAGIYSKKMKGNINSRFNDYYIDLK